MSKFLWFLGGCAAGVVAAAAAQVLSENSESSSSQWDDSSPLGENDSAPITVVDAAGGDQDVARTPATLIV